MNWHVHLKLWVSSLSLQHWALGVHLIQSDTGVTTERTNSWQCSATQELALSQEHPGFTRSLMLFSHLASCSNPEGARLSFSHPLNCRMSLCKSLCKPQLQRLAACWISAQGLRPLSESQSPKAEIDPSVSWSSRLSARKDAKSHIWAVSIQVTSPNILRESLRATPAFHSSPIPRLANMVLLNSAKTGSVLVWVTFGTMPQMHAGTIRVLSSGSRFSGPPTPTSSDFPSDSGWEKWNVTKETWFPLVREWRCWKLQ